MTDRFKFASRFCLKLDSKKCLILVLESSSRPKPCASTNSWSLESRDSKYFRDSNDPQFSQNLAFLRLEFAQFW